MGFFYFLRYLDAMVEKEWRHIRFPSLTTACLRFKRRAFDKIAGQIEDIFVKKEISFFRPRQTKDV